MPLVIGIVTLLPKGQSKSNVEGADALAPAAERGENNRTVSAKIGIGEITIAQWEDNGILNSAP